MYAVVEINGKQYRAEQGKALTVDRIDVEAGSSVMFDKVLLLSAEAGVKVGNPYVAGVSVKAVFKYKPKKDYRRKQGHRQRYSVLTVQEIVGA